ncbi:hypothetical protein WH47_03504 [Habropoda laboriosa]|uniref:Uncharacterized protein n=1 Tax=Habropoda laboriosa TaxID=597456 RepID=A0A0L7RC90_9HYME|nr:hypothetical protein WH47_03504 [Habropoda laboriosa]
MPLYCDLCRNYENLLCCVVVMDARDRVSFDYEGVYYGVLSTDADETSSLVLLEFRGEYSPDKKRDVGFGRAIFYSSSGSCEVVRMDPYVRFQTVLASDVIIQFIRRLLDDIRLVGGKHAKDFNDLPARDGVVDLLARSRAIQGPYPWKEESREHAGHSRHGRNVARVVCNIRLPVTRQQIAFETIELMPTDETSCYELSP